MPVENPTISQVQESLRNAEQTRRQSIIKHIATAAACAAVAIFAVQCTDRYWNDSDFVKAMEGCNVVPSVRVVKQEELFSATTAVTGGDVALAAMKSKNECIRDILDYYQKTQTLRPVITVDKDDFVR